MSFKVTGKIEMIGDVQQVSESFKKREFVVSYLDGNYEQLIRFELKQNGTELIDSHKVGENVTVSFNLRGRKWQNKDGKDMFFTTLEAWAIEAEF